MCTIATDHSEEMVTLPESRLPWRTSDERACAKRIRQLANGDLSTVCWLCGKTARFGDPWVASRGAPFGVEGMLPAHRSCSSSVGARRWHEQNPGRHGGQIADP